MKIYKALTVFLIILILAVAGCLGIYVLKKDEIKAKYFSKNIETNTVIEEEKIEVEPEPEIEVIKTVGTGPKRPDDYTVEQGYSITQNYAKQNEQLDEIISNLKDDQLKNEIKKFISESKEKLESEKEEFEKYIEEGNKNKGKVTGPENKKFNYYTIGNMNDSYTLFFGSETEQKVKIETEWECINGYFSIAIYLTPYSYGEMEQFWDSVIRGYGVYDVCCATYDLYTGNKLQFSDLFFEGEDYGEEIYELMQGKIGKNLLQPFIKREFTVLPQDYEYFTLSKIFFPKKNKFFSEGVIISHEHCITTTPSVTILRDMKNIFENNVEINQHQRFDFRKTTVQEEILGVQFKIQKIKHWDYETGEKINRNVEKYLEYLIENDCFEKYIKAAGEPEMFSGTQLSNVVYIEYISNYKNNMETCCQGSIYYKSAYPMFRFELNQETGEIENLELGMAIEYLNNDKESLDKLQKILEDLKEL